MFNINSIRITAYTSEEPFYFEADFTTGLNIIRGDNAKGKSTLTQSILYVLGQEELLGGKNSSFVQSCLRKLIKDENDKNIIVFGSSIELEVFNGRDMVTLKRCSNVEGIDDRLIEVCYGGRLTNPSEAFRTEPMYVHDPGGASNQFYGFHKWLENYLGWNLPKVLSTGNKESRLYSQLIFPAFFIEQKVGWSNYLATIPYFGVKEPKKRAIEFLLQLDVSSNEKIKNQIDARLDEYKKDWQSKYDSIIRLVETDNISISGINRNIHTNFNQAECSLVLQRDSKYINVDKYLIEVNIKVTNSDDYYPVNDDVSEELKQKLEELKHESQNITDESDQLTNILSIEISQKKEINESLDEITKEIDKNNGALKVKKFGATLGSSLAQGLCPTCHQEIKDALLPLEITATPMSIEDNVKYLQGQRKIFESYLKTIESNISDIQLKVKSLKTLQDDVWLKIKHIRQQLSSDPRLPSFYHIREKLKLEEEIKKFKGYLTFFEKTLLELSDLINDYKDLLEKKNTLPKDGLSISDREKIKYFTDNFKSLLSNYGFQSCDISFIAISDETYFPIIDTSELINETLRNDSSGSDFARVMWAYTLSLYLVSEKYNANHPGFIFLDEPAQHSTANASAWQLFNSLSKAGCQSIVADSFNNSDQVFLETTKGIDFKLIRFEGRLLKRKNIVT